MTRGLIIEALDELARAKKKHPIWPDDPVRQVAILAGEAGEALKAALHFKEGRLTEGHDSKELARHEVIQTMAMCIRVLENINKWE